jgi:membrane protease YdiL (CAAX protease family)
MDETSRIAETEESRFGSTLFHVALAAGVVPIVGLLWVLPLSIWASRTARTKSEHRWAGRLAMLVALDTVVALVVFSMMMGLLPTPAETVAPVESSFDPCASDSAPTYHGTLISYGIFLFGIFVLALIARRRGIRGGFRAWLPVATVPALGALAGSIVTAFACKLSIRDLVMETGLIGSEVVLVALGGVGLFLFARKAPEITWGGETPLAPSHTVLLGTFYIATWLPRVLALALPLMRWAQEHGLGGGSEALGAVLGADRTPFALALTFIAGAVLAPLGEELLFRGILLPQLAQMMKPWVAIVVSALLFGALHEAHGVARIGPMAIGVILGWARLRSGTLWASIAIHMIVNTTALSLAWFAGG